MSAWHRKIFPIELARRAIAATSIALVLLLTALSASPDLHRLFHDHADGGVDDGCAVVLFSHGVSAVADTAILAATPMVWHRAERATVAEIFLATPRFLHQPERGPPAV
ncbi:MAG: hypothetical protein JWM35_1728 [Verrucomicrobia bacterium]|nr:hypothetical protein [Verrucomicrobiota bacterium]